MAVYLRISILHCSNNNTTLTGTILVILLYNIGVRNVAWIYSKEAMKQFYVWSFYFIYFMHCLLVFQLVYILHWITRSNSHFALLSSHPVYQSHQPQWGLDHRWCHGHCHRGELLWRAAGGVWQHAGLEWGGNFFLKYFTKNFKMIYMSNGSPRLEDLWAV